MFRFILIVTCVLCSPFLPGAAWAQQSAPPPPPPPPAPPAPPVAQGEAATPEATADQAQVAELLSFLPATVATYGDRTVTADQVRILLAPALRMALAAGDPAPSRQVLRTQVLRLIDSIIDQQLLVAAATADGFAPRPVAARQTLGDLEKQMGAEAFQRKLQQQGMPLETIVQRMADAKAVGEWVENKVLSTVAVPDEEARAYYEARLGEYQAPERLRVSHILVRTSARDPEAKRREARRKAEDLLSRARAGADFALLARENSDCPSKSNGGDLGFFTRGHLPAGLETAAEALKPGELSGIVETTLGLHIVLGGERKAAATRPFQAEKARIVETLRQEKVKRTLRGIAAAAREKVEVRVLVPEDG